MSFSIDGNTKITVTNNPPAVNLEKESSFQSHANRPDKQTKRYDLLTIEQPHSHFNGFVNYSRFTEETPYKSASKTTENTDSIIRNLSSFENLRQQAIAYQKIDIFGQGQFRS